MRVHCLNVGHHGFCTTSFARNKIAVFASRPATRRRPRCRRHFDPTVGVLAKRAYFLLHRLFHRLIARGVLGDPCVTRSACMRGRSTHAGIFPSRARRPTSVTLRMVAWVPVRSSPLPSCLRSRARASKAYDSGVFEARTGSPTRPPLRCVRVCVCAYVSVYMRTLT